MSCGRGGVSRRVRRGRRGGKEFHAETQRFLLNSNRGSPPCETLRTQREKTNLLKPVDNSFVAIHQAFFTEIYH